MKKILLILSIWAIASTSTVAFGNESSSNSSADPIFQKIEYVINSKPVEMGDEYTSIYYNGHIYTPIRFIAEQTSGTVDYDVNTSTVTFNTYQVTDKNLCQIYGPRVSSDKAKIVAYEKYHLVHVDEEFTMRAPTKEELQLGNIQSDTPSYSPPYYILTGTDKDNNKILIGVSSNDKNNSFMEMPNLNVE
jgi:hypothetical protein